VELHLADWVERALDAVRAGSAWERYDFELDEGEHLDPVLASFGELVRSLDSDDPTVVLYIPVVDAPSDPTEPFQSLAELSPWRNNRVPKLYVLRRAVLSAWGFDRTEVWTAFASDPALPSGTQMRGLTDGDGDEWDRSWVLRPADAALRSFDTIT